MGDFLSRLPSVSSSFSSQSQQMAAPSSRAYSIRQSPHDSKLTVLHPVGYPEQAPPVFSAVVHKTSKPNVLVYRGAPNTYAPIGDARFHSFSSTTDVTHRGEPIRMKQSQLSGSVTVEAPRGMRFKWHVNQLSGSSMELRDSQGTTLATLKRASGMVGFMEKRLEILVACDERLVELIVVTGLIAKVLNSQLAEGQGEIAAAGGEAAAASVGV